MVKFKLTVKSEGVNQRTPYIGKDGKVFTNLMIGAIENNVLDLTGKMIAAKGLEASQRVLKLSAIYFQRVVSRTPRDETYTYYDKDGVKRTHKDDGDYIQDYWTARYWRYAPITAKYLRESCGCTFETFDNPKEIEIIYREFEKVFFGAEGSRGRANKESGKTTLKGIRINCEYPDDKQHRLRYHLLEYGGYTGDGIIKDGERYHGVIGGRSVQAPSGMKALTDAEFNSSQFKSSNENLTKYLKKLKKVKDVKSVQRLLKGKIKFSDSDIAKIMELYGV